MATREQCERAITRHRNELKKLKNYNGLGIRTVKDDRNDGKTEYAVAVYVTKKLEKEMLDPDDIVPALLEVSSRSKVIQVPTMVAELIGEIRLQGDHPAR